MHLSCAHPALIIVDMQNDFLRPGAPMEIAAGRAIVPGVAALAAQFRAAGLPVVHLRFRASDGYDGLAGRLPWIRRMAPPVCACVPGHLRAYADGSGEGFAVIDALAPQPGDLVVDKLYYSGFHGTDLDAQLRASGADALYVTGVLTEMCVEDTARHAVHHGWRTAILRDLVASHDAPAAEAALHAFARNYGWVATAAQAVPHLRQVRA